jgi:rhamnose utilization protein RhaD (predicted bifunctional aldolase and dehydrogenase)
MQEKMQQVIEMSNTLGSDAYDCAILGEGNTSVKIDQETFWVKASGTQLATIGADGFVKVRFATVLEAMQQESLGDANVKDVLLNATVDNPDRKMPSVETFLHAILLSHDNINFVGHTHPTAINSILCSQKAAEAYSGSLFPDQIVVLGAEPLFLPYTDPGLVLAKSLQTHVADYLKRVGQPPKTIYMQNHGFIALGATAKDVLKITRMAVKTAKILLGAYLMGGPNFFSDANVQRIETRPDEKYRRTVI